jgi:DNA-binding NtrC family response regulator
MNQEDRVKNVSQWLDEGSPLSIFINAYPHVPHQPIDRETPWTDPGMDISLEKIVESLASTYLAANLNFKTVPLKEFMDGFEKKILLACLCLTHGHQKNAAAVLRLKPTALLAKMRKHGIRTHREKLPEPLVSSTPEKTA